MPFLRASLFNMTLYDVITYNEFIEVYHTYKNNSEIQVNLVKIENTLPRKIFWGFLLLFFIFIIHIQRKQMKFFKHRFMENTILPLNASKRESLDMDLIRKYDFEYNDSPLHKRKNFLRSPKLSNTGSSYTIHHSSSQDSLTENNSSPLESTKESF